MQNNINLLSSNLALYLPLNSRESCDIYEVYVLTPELIRVAGGTLLDILRDMLEIGNTEPIPLENKMITKNAMDLVSRYLQFHNIDEISGELVDDKVSDGDKSFLNSLDKYSLFELTETADFMNVKLLYLSCVYYIAEIVKPMDLHQTRLYFEVDPSNHYGFGSVEEELKAAESLKWMSDTAASETNV